MIYSKEEKAKWLENWRQSGKSAWSYAKGNKLNPQTFLKWVKKGKLEISTEKTKQNFVEVPMQALTMAIPPVKSGSEILIEKGDVKIHIPLSCGCNELQAVMEGLGKVLLFGVRHDD